MVRRGSGDRRPVMRAAGAAAVVGVAAGAAQGTSPRAGRGLAAAGGTQYRMRQRMLAIGDDFWIEDNNGRRAFKVDGKALRIRQTLNFEDTQGRMLCRIQERMLRVKDTMEIEGPNGEQLALVRKAIITPIRDRWTVRIANGPDLNVQGSILDHEYSIGEEGRPVAQISKKWFRIRDTYGVQIAAGQNEIVILAVTVAIDMMAHGGR
jgi:uncharacterized protein YxjI